MSLQWYNRMLLTHPIITKTLSTGVIISMGDIVSQLFDHFRSASTSQKEPTSSSSFSWDHIRTAKMFTWGLVVGPSLHGWVLYSCNHMLEIDGETCYLSAHSQHIPHPSHTHTLLRFGWTALVPATRENVPCNCCDGKQEAADCPGGQETHHRSIGICTAEHRSVPHIHGHH